jgi:hypothetical protein
MLIAAGLCMICLAAAKLQQGKVVFDNASYHQTTFAAGGIGIGLLLILLAFLPSSEWVYRRISTKRASGLSSKKKIRH